MDKTFEMFFNQSYHEQQQKQLMRYLFTIIAFFVILIVEIVITIWLYDNQMHWFWTILTTACVVLVGWTVIFIVVDKIIPLLKMKRFFKEALLSELKEVQGQWTDYDENIYQMNGFSCHKILLKDHHKSSTYFIMEAFEIPKEFMHKTIQLKTLDLMVVAYKAVDIS